MSKERYEWIFKNGENEIIDNMTSQYVTVRSPGLLNEKDRKIADLEAKLAESEKELLQKEKKIEDLMLCEFVATTLDFNKLSADNCRLREQLADIETNKEKEINRICKTHIEANAQLKQQLSEKDEAIENWQTMYKSVVQTCHNDKEEIERLNKQLAEKEKEIKNIKLCRCVNCTNEYEFMLEGLVEDLEKQIDKDNQDKISFAVEQLEKVKELLFEKAIEITGASVDGVRLYSINEIFSNQIKQLKEMK